MPPRRIRAHIRDDADAPEASADPSTSDDRLAALEDRVAALEKALDHPNLAAMIGRTVPPRDEPAESFPHLALDDLRPRPESQEAN